MTRHPPLFSPQKLHICWQADRVDSAVPTTRRYTLTHSDATGDLFLTIGQDYDRKQISGWYTRLMRDEVLGEWLFKENAPALHIYLHVSGGLAFGPPGWRYGIFRQHMPMVLQVICWGDREFIRNNHNLLDTPIQLHFYSRAKAFNKMETSGKVRDYFIDTSLAGV